MDKFLVTGAGGFIASNLLYELAKRSNTTVTAARHTTTDDWRIKKLSSLVNIVNCDLTIFEQVKKLVLECKPDYVIHLATRGVYSRQWSDPVSVLSGNYSMSVNLLEAVKEFKNNIKGFVNVGSAFEYGTEAGAVKEDRPLGTESINFYAASKKATTILASAYKNLFPVVTLRLFSAYGPYNDINRFIEGVIYGHITGGAVRIPQGVIRDLIYVDDVSQALLAGSAAASKISGEVINIGSGKGYKLEQAYEIIKNIFKESGIEVPAEVSDTFRQPKETQCWADISNANELLGWNPQFSLEQGLRQTIEWYKQFHTTIPKIST